MPVVATRSSSGHAPAPDQVQHLADARLAGQAAVLEHRADAAGADGVGRGTAQHLDGAGVRAQQPEDGADGGGLPGAVGAEQRDGLTAADVQVEAVDGEDVSVADGQVGDVEGVGRHATSVLVSEVSAVVRDVAISV